MFDEILNKFYKEHIYKKSKEFVEKIDAINTEIDRCNKDLENTEIAETFTCSWYEPGGFCFSGSVVDMEYEIDTEILKRILKVGIQAYKDELITKKKKLLKSGGI